MKTRGYGSADDQAAAQELANIQDHISKLRLGNSQRQNNILRKQFALQGTSPGPATGKLPFFMAPGNVGDLNMMIWPFFYGTTYCEVAPGTTQPTDSPSRKRQRLF